MSTTTTTAADAMMLPPQYSINDLKHIYTPQFGYDLLCELKSLCTKRYQLMLNLFQQYGFDYIINTNNNDNPNNTINEISTQMITKIESYLTTIIDQSPSDQFQHLQTQFNTFFPIYSQHRLLINILITQSLQELYNFLFEEYTLSKCQFIGLSDIFRKYPHISHHLETQTQLQLKQHAILPSSQQLTILPNSNPTSTHEELQAVETNVDLQPSTNLVYGEFILESLILSLWSEVVDIHNILHAYSTKRNNNTILYQTSTPAFNEKSNNTNNKQEQYPLSPFQINTRYEETDNTQWISITNTNEPKFPNDMIFNNINIRKYLDSTTYTNYSCQFTIEQDELEQSNNDDISSDSDNSSSEDENDDDNDGDDNDGDENVSGHINDQDNKNNDHIDTSIQQQGCGKMNQLHNDQSIQQLLQYDLTTPYIQHSSHPNQITNQKHVNQHKFMDLGGGVGRLTLFLPFLTNSFTHSTSIEIIPTFHNIAVQFAQYIELLMKNDCEIIHQITNTTNTNLCYKPNQQTEINIINGSFFDIDWSCSDFILTTSTCFSQEMFELLSLQSSQLKSGSIILTLRQQLYHPSIILLTTMDLMMTWGPARAYFHMRI